MSEKGKSEKKVASSSKPNAPRTTSMTRLSSKPGSSRRLSTDPEGNPSSEKLNPSIDEPYMLVAIGPGTSHCIQGPKTWEAKGFWQTRGDKKKDFTSVIQKVKGIPKCASFGKGGTWYVLYEYPMVDQTSGKKVVKVTDQGEGLEKHYPKLATWLWKSGLKVANADDLWVALGPKGSFWAWQKDKGIYQHEAPRDLLKQMGNQEGACPRVTLGKDGASIWWNDKGGRGYRGKLDPDVEKFLKKFDADTYAEKKKINIRAAALSLERSAGGDAYFVLLQNGAYTRMAPVSVYNLLTKYVAEFMGNMKRDLVYGTNVNEWDTTGVKVGVDRRYGKIGEDRYNNAKEAVRDSKNR